jgi:hydrogenase nickel incorporation protein HypA/HybF
VHEYSIVQSLIGLVEAQARARGATAIHRVRVGLGALAGVDPELLATAYDAFRARTICANAELELRRVEARWECERCGISPERGARLVCVSCGGPARLVQGDELSLDSIEMEVP